MNCLQAVQEICKVIPDIQDEFTEDKTQNPYSVIRIFTNRIKGMVRQDERKILFKSLDKMDEIYRNGDQILKNAVENIFIYSFDGLTVICNQEFRKVIFSYLSDDMQKIYFRQIYSHGI
ncbi:hypothetical protein ODZ84_08610 [Chryseobacterium fluminis]|uniref:DUF7674 family protein n=1 Tax=Chryseobacterium fluminis TaxID=2983606 RepID=UPI002255F73C|nr:hypothetical protein [Chryseobacterium sp. MMS21-Ot14]UZT99609.1 hypothetical protein ODZ84_08610 [Chryseobacterium sp. MMS21-Ot14]